MISRHEFNTAWWGADVGIVADPGFFRLDGASRQAALEPYRWVELVLPQSAVPDRRLLAGAGFFTTDVQVRFRMDLTRVQPGPTASGLTIERAPIEGFQINPADLRPFRHERFNSLPGVTEEKVTERYALWANKLSREHHATALELKLDGRLQGWFLAQPQPGRRAELTLSMLAPTAVVSGYDLYARALQEFARAGFRLGFAGFSISNSAVHNIYAALGARFLEPVECWMWVQTGP